MYDDKGDTFIVTLHNVLLAPYIYDRLFCIITLMNSENACLFHKVFSTDYFVDKGKNAVTLPHISQQKHAFWEK